MPLAQGKFRSKPTLNEETMTISVDIIERDSEKVVLTESFDGAKIAESLRKFVALYGLNKLLFDRSSDVNFADGKTTPEEKAAALREVYDMLCNGVRERERKAGAPLVSVEVTALAEIKGVTVREAQVALKKYTKEQREQIFAKPAIQAKVAEIKARDAAAESLDLGDLAPDEE